jgi:hypothetical protein
LIITCAFAAGTLAASKLATSKLAASKLAASEMTANQPAANGANNNARTLKVVFTRQAYIKPPWLLNAR